jgi:leucyl aminopeptidase
MEFKIARERIEEYSGDALILLLQQDGPSIKGVLSDIVKKAYSVGSFKAEKKEIFQVFPCDGIKAGRLILVGLGKKKKSSIEDIRKAAGSAIRTVQKLKRVAFLPVGNPKDTIPALAEGVILGNYRFDSLKSDKKEMNLKEISFFPGNSRFPESKLSEAVALADGTCIARDFANTPANLLTPRKFADEAVKLCKKNGLKVNVLMEDELKKLNMGALLAVGQGFCGMGIQRRQKKRRPAGFRGQRGNLRLRWPVSETGPGDGGNERGYGRRCRGYLPDPGPGKTPASNKRDWHYSPGGKPSVRIRLSAR